MICQIDFTGTSKGITEREPTRGWCGGSGVAKFHKAAIGRNWNDWVSWVV